MVVYAPGKLQSSDYKLSFQHKEFRNLLGYRLQVMHSGVAKGNRIYPLSQLEGLQGSADMEQHSAISLGSL